MIDGSEKGNRQLAFELRNSQVCEKRSKASIPQTPTTFCKLDYILENGKIRFFSFFLSRMYTKQGLPVHEPPLWT